MSANDHTPDDSECHYVLDGDYLGRCRECGHLYRGHKGHAKLSVCRKCCAPTPAAPASPAKEATREGEADIESLYMKVCTAALECDPIPACKREDDRLEPPWEVMLRMKAEKAAAESERDALKAEARLLKAILGELIRHIPPVSPLDLSASWMTVQLKVAELRRAQEALAPAASKEVEA